MSLPFVFPATLEAFIAYQEKLINRPLTEDEREVTAVWWPIINEAAPGDLQTVDEFITRSPGNTWISRFLKAARAWMEVSCHER